ncbi:hypothetical protein RB614_32710 [Phytohabitans sp. ZYX-F-186]|uniref:DUF559 domain-containing protein n=1 Tax=Phytohabitans maris TaxID=3071409 RepID=A0ABU0ZQQ5_9ACTN|nr:hypothetical protein [Phytohabitans sp. ZYX-F-186]MDQ7909293.1 hypothetical protein [Phytohabitans sp. ZYX-F-186]
MQDGVISRRQALRYFSQKALRHRLTTGRWQIAHPGVYLTHSGQMSVHQRRWVASLAVGGGHPAMLGGPSALAVLGMRGLDSHRIHVLASVRRQHRRLPPGVVLHRTRHLPPEDQHRLGRPPCTMPARSLVDAARWADSDREAVAVIAAGFQQRLVAAVDMAPVLARMTHVKRRQLIIAAVADASGGTESIAEVDFARLCRRHGLPEPSRQAVRTDSAGRRRYRDVYFERWRLHVEIDGAQHMEVASWYADMRLQNEITIAGERLLRFPAWMIRQNPDDAAAQVRAALTAAGWRR